MDVVWLKRDVRLHDHGPFAEVARSKNPFLILSPNTSWNSCSRLSPYLTWGHLSLRFAIQALYERQEALRKNKASKKKTGGGGCTWLKSLQAFSSRLHWRSHFIQKLESEPMLEKRDLCAAYQPLRRQEGDWNESYYQAWSTGFTGFPFVDACMRCLIQYGWLNFRMRAMLISFATYNLWLDWKRIAPHMARVFLDYEPGIHYPQLQMQSGCTGINAMRVYSVTKQAKDQDRDGTFIRRHIPELRNVPTKYIHEPWKMPLSAQRQYKVTIVTKQKTSTITNTLVQEKEREDLEYYPEPIVNEQKSAKEAKDKVASIRNLDTTKRMANQVYQKHGSRNNREREQMDFIVSSSKKQKSSPDKSAEKSDSSKQPKISSVFSPSSKLKTAVQSMKNNDKPQRTTATKVASLNTEIYDDDEDNDTSKPIITALFAEEKNEGKASNEIIIIDETPPQSTTLSTSDCSQKSHCSLQKLDSSYQKKMLSIFNTTPEKKSSVNSDESNSWDCKACTFLNDKPLGLICSMCSTPRE